jgi:hypothetical protein
VEAETNPVGQGEQVSYIPSLGEDEDLHGIDTLEEGLQPPRPPGSKGLLHANEDTIP